MRRSFGHKLGESIFYNVAAIGKLTKQFPYMARVAKLEQNVKDIPELKQKVRTNRIYEKIIAISKRLAGFPRHLSIHAGGVIIAPVTSVVRT